MNRRNAWSIVADIMTIIISLLWIAPLFFAFLVSIRPTSDPLGTGNIFFGRTITLENYQRMFELAPWQWHYLTSVLVVIGVLSVQLITITLAGYAFARMKFWGHNALLIILLIQLMIPSGVLIVQNLNLMRQLNLFDTRWALIIPYWGSAFGVLLMRQTFREIPIELEEAARIDGANLFQILRFVYIPLSIPSYVAFALVSMSARWNDFLWPAMVTRTTESRPVTTGLSQLFSATEAGTNYGQLMAGTILVVAPLVVLFILFQRRFIDSFASSGLK